MKVDKSHPSRHAPLRAEWQRLGVHRASQAAVMQTWSTGWPALDARLPGGGYPLAAVTEFLLEHGGRGELSLLLPALAPKLAADPDSRLVLLDPPYRLNAPALDAAGIDRARAPVICCRDTNERVWSIEQLAAAGGFVAFVLWDDALDTAAFHRLQLAGERAGCPIFVYRAIRSLRQRSPAALRLALTACGGQQQIEVVKCRGPAGARLNGLSPGQETPWHWAHPRGIPSAPVPHDAFNQDGSDGPTMPNGLRDGRSALRPRPSNP